MLGVLSKMLHRRVLKITPGVQYRLRSGHNITIISEEFGDDQALSGYTYRDDNGRRYNREGRMHHQRRFTMPGVESKFDIVDYA